MKFWPRYAGDWKKKTADLTLAEKGAYTELLDWCYSNECPLPFEMERLWAIANARSPLEQRAVEVVLKRFFVKNGEGFINERAQEELQKWKSKSDKAKLSANKRWHKP